MKALLKFEYRKLFRQKSFYVCGVLLTAFVFFSAAVSRLAADNAQEIAVPLPTAIGMLRTALQGANATLIVGIFAALFVCGDHADGTLKGSVLKMNEAVRRMVREVGLPTEYAVRCASLNPAAVLGVSEEYGSIRTGKYADFTIVNEDFEVLAVYRGGERIFGETI